MVHEQKPWTGPILRWAGSKRGLVPQLRALMPTSFGTYIEPFAGSACLFFAVRPRHAVLGDFNSDLIEMYSILRSHPRRLHRRLSEMEVSAESYYRVRSVAPSTLTPFERAARFLYLNRNCFNGVYRTNRRNEFNVPFGSRTPRLPSEADFFRAAYALRSSQLIAGDFTDTTSDAVRGDLVYLDPPYVTQGRAMRGEYGYGAFGAADLARLVDVVKDLDRRGVSVVLSYTIDETLIRSLPGWGCRYIPIRRMVAGGGQRSRDSSELMLYNDPGRGRAA